VVCRHSLHRRIRWYLPHHDRWKNICLFHRHSWNCTLRSTRGDHCFRLCGRAQS